jgi:hypothetical protein
VSDSGRSASKRLSNAPDKQVTNGVVGSVISTAAMLVLTQYVETGFDATGSLKDSSSQRRCFPGLFAGHKGNGKGSCFRCALYGFIPVAQTHSD